MEAHRATRVAEMATTISARSLRRLGLQEIPAPAARPVFPDRNERLRLSSDLTREAMGRDQRKAEGLDPLGSSCAGREGFRLCLTRARL